LVRYGSIGVRVKLVEALMVRGSGELQAGAWIRGFSPMLPTTLIGALAHVGWCIDNACSVGNRWDALRRCVASLISRKFRVNVGWEDLRFRGPALLVEGGGDGLFVMCREGLVEVSPQGIVDWVRRQERGERPGKRAGNVRHRLIRPEAFITERTGVGLVRETKVAKEGLLFTVPYMSNYVSIDGFRAGRITVVADLLVTSPISGIDVRVVAVRLGGEDRKALAELSTRSVLVGILERMWEGRGGGEAVLVLLTPLLLPQLSGKDGLSLRDLEEVVLRVVDESLDGYASVSGGVFSVHPGVRPRVVPLQLGFDERARVKGSILPALLPGAVFRAHVTDWAEVYQRGAGHLSEVGFGTLLPLPLTH